MGRVHGLPSRLRKLLGFDGEQSEPRRYSSSIDGDAHRMEFHGLLSAAKY